ncbi:MAG: hypothetical protein NVS4B3_06530 [Gemmatimonadaceae bacterium]
MDSGAKRTNDDHVACSGDAKGPPIAALHDGSRRWYLFAALLAITCCHGKAAVLSDRHAREAIQRAALDTVFRGRERAALLTLAAHDRRDARDRGLQRLAGALPVTIVTDGELAQLFRDHADGWAAFFLRYPGSAGLVSIAIPAVARDGTATVRLNRLCGEHCESVFVVTLTPRPSGVWTPTSIAFLPAGGVGQ